MKIQDILLRCKEIKKSGKTTYSNYYNKYNACDIDFDVIEENGTVVFGLKEEFIYRVYFCSNNLSSLKECLLKVKKGSVIDWIFKGHADEIEEILRGGGWEKYGEYARTMLPVPNVKKEKTKMDLLLEKMYDPGIAELAGEADVPAIRKLMLDTFDPVNSEIMSEEELKRLVKEETVWLYKVGGRIATCYIFRMEGKKRYGAMTYNCLSADYLYSVTKKAHEISDVKHKPKWHYGWINMENKKIIRSLKAVDELQLDGVRNVIYTKV